MTSRHDRRAAIVEFRREAARGSLVTFLIGVDDPALASDRLLSSAALYWRGNIKSRRPKCVACKTLFTSDGVVAGGFLFAHPEAAAQVSVSAFCTRCWNGLPYNEIERHAMKVLHTLKPNAAAKFEDASS